MRSKKIPLFLIFAAALLFHSIVYYTVLSDNDPFLKYPDFARSYVAGSTENERLVDFSPLYLGVHIIARKIAGSPEDFMRWVQFVLIACSTTLVFLLLRPYFGVVLAASGAVVFTTSRSIMAYASAFEPEVFLIIFLLAFLVCATQKSKPMAAAAGTFLALALCTRLNLFVLAAITPLFYYLDRYNRKSFRARSLLFLVPVAIALLALSIRNKSAIGEFTPVVMNPGQVFYEGNNPNANGQNAVYPPMIDNATEELAGEVDAAHVAYRLFARHSSGQMLSVSGVNAFWSGKAWNFILDHPVFWLGRAAGKLRYAFHDGRWHDIITVFANDRALGRFPSVPFGVISAFTIVGMILSARRWRQWLVLYAALFTQIGVMTMTYASDRQRISVLALFVFFALVTVHYLIAVRSAVWKKTAVSLVVLALCPLLFMETGTQRDSLYERDHVERAHELFRQARLDRDNGRLRDAAKKNVLAYAYIPYLAESRMAGLRFEHPGYEERALALADSLYAKNADPSAQLDLAVLLIENSRLDRAETILVDLAVKNRSFARMSALSSQPLFYLAKIHALQGAREHVVADLRQALKKNPGDPWALSWLGVVTGDEKYRECIVRYFSDIDADWFMGMALLDNRRYREAADCFASVIEKIPEYQVGVMYLSLALGLSDNTDQAAARFIQSMQKKGEPLFREKEFLEIFHRWVEQDPGNAERNYFFGMVLKAFGRYDEALAAFSRIPGGDPAALSAAEQRAWLKQAAQSYRY